MKLELEFDRETDGRWIAEIPAIPGAMAYGKTPQEAASKAQAIALHFIAEKMENASAAIYL